MHLKNTTRIILLIISVCIFVYSFFNIAKKVYGYYHDNKQYEQIRSQVERNKTPDITITECTSAEDTQLKPASADSLPYTIIYESSDNLDANGVLKDYSNLYNQNSDLAGWIRIPGFKKVIDYPVMQAADNDFYLARDFYKNSSLAGSIYMDSRNNDLDDRNIVIYGHAMKDYSMFGNLKDFSKQPDKYTKVKKIYLDLINSQSEYEIFSIYNGKADSNYRQVSFSDDNEYMAFLNNINSKSAYNYGIRLNAKDKILTLSTCSDEGNIRSVIHARLVKKIVYTSSVKKPDEMDASEQQGGKNIITANIYLKNLVISYYLGNKYENAVLTPVFNNNIKEYEASLPAGAEKFSINFEADDPMAKAILTLNDNVITQVSGKPVPTKPASVKPTPAPTPTPIPVSLKSGNESNIIKIKIVSQDSQYSRTYTINIIRLPESGETEAGAGTKASSVASDAAAATAATTTVNATGNTAGNAASKPADKTTETVTGSAGGNP